MSTRIRRGSPKERLEPRKKPAQSRSRSTVEDILCAAAQVFEDCGYAAGTTNRIAARAGVSIGTLYQYYPSKEALAVALLEQHLSETMTRLDDWARRSAVGPRSLHQTLRDYVQGMVDLHSKRPRLQHILLEETPLPPRVHDASQRAEREAASTMAGLLCLYPEVRHRGLDRAAFLAVQTIWTLTHSYAAHPGQTIDREAFADELVAMLEAYLTREPASR